MVVVVDLWKEVYWNQIDHVGVDLVVYVDLRVEYVGL